DGEPRPVPRITDFGLAKLLDEVEEPTRTVSSRLGTPGFAAPEQAASRRARIGPAADVYGLGAILQTLLTGRPPAAPIRAERDLLGGRPHLPQPLRKILAGCLQADPEDRYPTAAALAGDLRRFLAGKPLHARLPRGRLRLWGLRIGRVAVGLGIL